MEKVTLRSLTEDLINLKAEKKKTNKEYNEQIKALEMQIEMAIKEGNQQKLDLD